MSKFIKSLKNKELQLQNKSITSSKFPRKAKSKLVNHNNRIYNRKKSAKNLKQKKENYKIFSSYYNDDC